MYRVQAWTGSIARALENRSLKWETTDTKNIGFDFGLFGNHLNGNINYYINETRDLLITRRIAPSAGLDNPTLNVGKMRNQGFELELNWNDKISDFEYNVGFNISTIANKVVALANEDNLWCRFEVWYRALPNPDQGRQANRSFLSLSGRRHLPES